jgi:HipA-like protein
MRGIRRAEVFTGRKSAGMLAEVKKNEKYRFTYHDDYTGQPLSPKMPVSKRTFVYKHLPSVFADLLPKGKTLLTFLKRHRLDARDYFGQLLAVAKKGALRVREIRYVDMDIDIDDELYELASALAKKKGISTEEWISNAVTSFFRKYEKEKVKCPAAVKKGKSRA